MKNQKERKEASVQMCSKIKTECPLVGTVLHCCLEHFVRPQCRSEVIISHSFFNINDGSAGINNTEDKSSRKWQDDLTAACTEGKASIAFVRTRTLLVGQKPEPTFLFDAIAECLRRCLKRRWSYEG